MGLSPLVRFGPIERLIDRACRKKPPSAAALGMAKAAAPCADVFVKAALPADFIDQLVAAANATVASVGTRKQSRVAGAGATKGLKTTLSTARKSVHALDGLVKSALKDDPPLLAAWRTARRVE